MRRVKFTLIHKSVSSVYIVVSHGEMSLCSIWIVTSMHCIVCKSLKYGHSTPTAFNKCTVAYYEIIYRTDD